MHGSKVYSTHPKKSGSETATKMSSRYSPSESRSDSRRACTTSFHARPNDCHSAEVGPSDTDDDVAPASGVARRVTPSPASMALESSSGEAPTPIRGVGGSWHVPLPRRGGCAAVGSLS